MTSVDEILATWLDKFMKTALIFRRTTTTVSRVARTILMDITWWCTAAARRSMRSMRSTSAT